MIWIYEQGYEDFSTNGLGSLLPTRCQISEEQNGAYELELDHPIDEDGLFNLLKTGRVIKAPVPAQTTPIINMPATTSYEVWETVAISKVYTKKSTSLGSSVSVTVPAIDLTDVKPGVVAVRGYTDNTQQTITKWKPNGNRVLESVESGVQVSVLSKDGSWYQATTPNGNTGWMQAANLTLIAEIAARPAETIQERKIRDQLFRIYRAEKDTVTGMVKVWARHISYDLLGNVLLNCDVQNKTVTQAIAQIDAACTQTDHGFAIYTDSSEIVTADWSRKGYLEALLDPDEGLVSLANLRLIRDNYDIFLLTRSEVSRQSVSYGTNLMGVTLEINDDGIVNRIVPVGKTKDGDPLYIDAEYVDSPRNNEATIISARVIEYDVAESDDLTLADAKTALIAKANEDYERGIDLPEITVNVDFLQLGDTVEYAAYKDLDRLYLGDLITVVDDVHDIELNAEITQVEYDVLTDRYLKMNVGVTEAARTIGSTASFMLQNNSLSGRKIAIGSIDGSRIDELNATKITTGFLAAGIIQAGTITSDKLYAGEIEASKIQAENIAAGELTATHIASGTITSDKLYSGEVEASKIQAENIAAGEITATHISTNEIVANAANIKDGVITNAKIATAGIDYAKIKDMSAGTAIITTGVGDDLFIGRLVVTDANMASATIGQLMVRDADGDLWKISIDNDGEVTATAVTVDGANISDGAIINISSRLIFSQATAPNSPFVGMMWQDTTNGQLKRCTDTDPLTWDIVPSGEVHTAVIDVDENGMTIADTGDLTILSGATLNIKALGDVANVITMDNGGINIATGGSLNLSAASQITIGTNPFSVGGTNLLTGTDYETSYTAWTPNTVNTTQSLDPSTAVFGTKSLLISRPASDSYGGVYRFVSLLANTTYTFSVWAYVYAGSWYINSTGYANQPMSGGWQRYSYTITTTTAGNYPISILAVDSAEPAHIFIDRPKLEKGTIATDWSPSPQDTIDALAVLDGRLGDVETRVQVFYQASKPTYAAVGDLWYDTDSNPLEVWECTNVSTQAHTAFTDPVLTRALSAQTTANSKIITFVQSTTPTALAAGDLWLDTGNKNIWKRATAAGTGGWVEYLTASGYLITTGITIDGTDLTVKATGNLNLASDGNMNVQNGGNLNVLNGGDIEVNSGGDINVASGGNVNIAAGGKLNLVGADGIYIGTSPFSVGGTNLLTGTDYETSYTAWTPNTVNTTQSLDPSTAVFGTKSLLISRPASDGYGGVYRFVSLLENTIYTFSVWAYVYAGSWYIDSPGYASKPMSGGWQRYSYTITTTTAGNYPIRILAVDSAEPAHIFIDRPKLEMGPIATDWSPAPSDPASGVVTSHVTIEDDSIEIASGGSLNVTAPTTLSITAGATNATAIGIKNTGDYFLTAGHLTPASAPFRVKMDGSVVATKIQQEYSQSYWDLADASYPAEFPVYIPSGYTIDTVTFTFVTGKYRSFAKAASTPSTTYTSTPDTDYSGGPSSDATGSASGNTAGGGSHSHTVVGSSTDTVLNHTHGLNSHTHTLGAHYHGLNGHKHTLNSHTHGLTYGIYEKSTLATSCDLKIGATTIGTYSPNPASPVEIKTYLSAGWNTVVVQPNDDARIAAYLLVKLTPS